MLDNYNQYADTPSREELNHDALLEKYQKDLHKILRNYEKQELIDMIDNFVEEKHLDIEDVIKYILDGEL